MKQLLIILLLLFLSTLRVSASKKFKSPIKWEFNSSKTSDTTYHIKFEATLDKGWHIYSQFLENNEGPIPTTISFSEPKSIKLIGKTKELGEVHNEYDPNFEMKLHYYNNHIVFSQEVIVKAGEKKIKGAIEYMVCDATKCLPPNFIEVIFDLEKGEGIDALLLSNEPEIDINGIIPMLPKVDTDNPKVDCQISTQSENIGQQTIFNIFLLGFFGGLIALITPCVFPMIPLTVSFFTKSEDKGGKGKATIYGLFIFLIYALLSVPFHFNTDPAILNELSTSIWLNLIFFAVFVIFAISFFGFFDITMPNSLANKAESASGSKGLIGIFFMALTLALVSFSCTGPILGTVLGSSLKNGPWPITAAMSGFGIALGLPFALFAHFPKILNKLPKSGGWLNSVKVVLGFIELALALKFLSNADLVKQWGLIKRETFFLIWLIICFGLTAYLLGWIKFPHDSAVKKFSKFRIGLIVFMIAVSIYIAPGILKKSPWQHHLLSGFPPPTFYSWYKSETFHAEFTDFYPAFEKARAENKPLLIDFTGWACVNCRKMEESVWTVDKVKEKLKNDFVLVSLYVDDKNLLPEEKRGIVSFGENNTQKKKISSIGNKWAAFQNITFKNQSQPHYVILSPEGELLNTPVGYTPDVDEYIKFLNCGLKAYRN